MASSIKTILFDLDGTLIDSAPSILAGFEFTLNSVGVTPVIPLDSSVIGPPLMHTLSLLSGVTSKNRLEEMITIFKGYYDTEGITKSQAYPKIADGLETLNQLGLQLHITTNKRYIPTQQILNNLCWQQWFKSVYSIDSHSNRFNDKKQMIAAQVNDLEIKTDQTLYIGDRHEDFIAANDNAIEFIGVSWGYGISASDQTTEKGYLVADSMPELIKLVKKKSGNG